MNLTTVPGDYLIEVKVTFRAVNVGFALSTEKKAGRQVESAFRQA